jgi:hypothetical protein
MLVREVFKDDVFIGYIGWDNGAITVKGNTALNEAILESMKGVIGIEESQLLNNISVSTKTNIFPDDGQWIANLESHQMAGITYGQIVNMTRPKFNSITL